MTYKNLWPKGNILFVFQLPIFLHETRKKFILRLFLNEIGCLIKARHWRANFVGKNFVKGQKIISGGNATSGPPDHLSNDISCVCTAWQSLSNFFFYTKNGNRFVF